MATQQTYLSEGGYQMIDCYSVVCPACGTRMIPRYLCADKPIIFARCSVSSCHALFLLHRVGEDDVLVPNRPLSTESFSPVIQEISSQFVKIYNEAFSAEQMGLMEICGAGYRKALEFLIKDYVMKGKSEEGQEKIKRMQLMLCIKEYVDNDNIKMVAERAAWLGNDETHYVRKWEEKDVQDLKGLIRLTIWWIEQTTETMKLLEEMPEGR